MTEEVRVHITSWNRHIRQRYEKKDCIVCGTEFEALKCRNRKFCSQTCANRTNSKRGSEHHSWKGGISENEHGERVKFQRTMQQLVFQRDSYTCQSCQQEGGYLQVDHIKKWSDYPELRFDMGNCRTLCMACHYFVTFKRKMPKGIVWGHNLSKRMTS